MNLFRKQSGYADLIEQSLERQRRAIEVKRFASLKTVPQRRKPTTITDRIWRAVDRSQWLCVAIVIGCAAILYFVTA